MPEEESGWEASRGRQRAERSQPSTPARSGGGGGAEAANGSAAGGGSGGNALGGGGGGGGGGEEEDADWGVMYSGAKDASHRSRGKHGRNAKQAMSRQYAIEARQAQREASRR